MEMENLHNRVTDRQTGRQLSIVIPVYNVADYLKDCLESCLKQDLDNYEIVCVDDGSTDNSGAILDQYAGQYSHIRVYHKENGGVSSARNYGVQKAHGKWIWFVDADDFIAENCCKFIYEVAENGDPEVIMFDQLKTDRYVAKAFSAEFASISKYLSQKAVLSMVTKRNYGNGPVMYWFRKEKVTQNQIAFDHTMKYGEDTKFVFQYKCLCNRGVVIDYPMYYYRQRGDSAMHNLDSNAHAYCMLQLALLYDEYADRYGDNEQMKSKMIVARSRAVRSMLFDYCFYIRNYDLAKEQLRIMQEKGFYPYRIKMGIYSKSLKGIAINIINECLRYKWIYLLLCRIMSLR